MIVMQCTGNSYDSVMQCDGNSYDSVICDGTSYDSVMQCNGNFYDSVMQCDAVCGCTEDGPASEWARGGSLTSLSEWTAWTGVTTSQSVLDL